MKRDMGKLLWLAIPTIVEEVLATLLQYVDTAMVGRLGERATASVNITTTITWLVGSMLGAVGTAFLILISKALGEKDGKQIQQLAQQAVLAAVVCGVLIGGVSVLLSPYIPIWMGAEAAIQGQASRYFLIISLPMVFRAFSMILGAALRAVQDTKTPMLISALANGMNAVLNYVLIYGLALGVTGAAIASALSYTLAGGLMAVAFWRNKTLNWRWSGLSFNKRILRECARVGSPVLGGSLVSCMGYVVFASLVSGMGTTIFAAHSIAVTAETIFYIPGYGLRTAASALIGEARGAGDGGRMRRLIWLSVLLTVGMMCGTGVLLYLIADPLMRLFSPSAQVVTLGAEMLRLVALSEPFFGLMVILEGIYYGLGRTKYTFFVETTGMWIIRILFTFLCIRIWRLGLREVWYCMIADNVCKAVLFLIPFLRKGEWDG